jgi:ADP-glucose pyrophosphorylase
VADAIQGAQPDPSPAARLELLPPERNESFDILPASQRVVADEVVSAARPTRSTRTSTSSRATAPQYMVVLAGDHIYKMDYEQMLRAARRTAAPT